MLDHDMAERRGQERTAVCLTSRAAALPWLDAWWADMGLERIDTDRSSVVVALSLRSRPRAVVIDARGNEEWQRAALATCQQLKCDAFTAVVPIVLIVPPDHFDAAFASGADEVLAEDVSPTEARARLRALLSRSDRDIDVHPSTRLPGARAIEAELARRVSAAAGFAACYADLDHFKEFNDRYGYHRGNQIICLVARILHDVVKGRCGAEGFVGHIGGDDFLFVVPLPVMARVCDEVIAVFDELIALQYSDQDRRVGYFFGKDRRGQMHRVSLMTLSIGVATNQRRRFTRAGEVSELATEMKTYAKTLDGSLWAVDRRADDSGLSPSNGFPTPGRDVHRAALSGENA